MLNQGFWIKIWHFQKLFKSKFNIPTLDVAKFVQVLESFRDLFKHRNYSQLHFCHRWPLHFGCANGFSGLCHAFFRWGFILEHGAYWWSSFLGRRPCCFGHFVFLCNLLTFLSHMDNTSFFFLHISFDRFQHDSYVSMWGHYGSRIMGVFSRPFSEVSGSITNIL
jgi:hypothetical protein